MTTATHARAAARAPALITGARELAGVVLVLALVGGAVLLTIWRKAVFVQVGYQISELERKESDLISKRRELEIERSMLNNPERIEKVARDRLGMTKPQAGQVRILR